MLHVGSDARQEVVMDSFLVQVWVPADGSPCGAQLRGVVRHVATGTETAFRNDEEVLRALRRARARRPPSAPREVQTTDVRRQGGVDR